MAACSGAGDTTIDITFDPCDEVLIAPAPEATDAQRALIADAIALWNEVYPTGLALAEPGTGDVSLWFEDAAPAFLGLYDDEAGEIFINSGLSDRATEITIAHEVGHAFGSVHIDSYRSVMNRGNTMTEPLEVDAAELVERWGACPSPK